MRNWPLSGRAVRIDRRPAGSTTWTNGAAKRNGRPVRRGNNWKGTLSTSAAGTFEYRATLFTSAAEPAVNTSNAVTWTIRWTTIGCPT